MWSEEEASFEGKSGMATVILVTFDSKCLMQKKIIGISKNSLISLKNGGGSKFNQ